MTRPPQVASRAVASRTPRDFDATPTGGPLRSCRRGHAPVAQQRRRTSFENGSKRPRVEDPVPKGARTAHQTPFSCVHGPIGRAQPNAAAPVQLVLGGVVTPFSGQGLRPAAVFTPVLDVRSRQIKPYRLR